MNLKHQYLISITGFVLLSFGGGWVALSVIIGVPNISIISAIGFIITGLGMAIVIKTLSTIRKIDLIVEEE